MRCVRVEGGKRDGKRGNKPAAGGEISAAGIDNGSFLHDSKKRNGVILLTLSSSVPGKLLRISLGGKDCGIAALHQPVNEKPVCVCVSVRVCVCGQQID